MGLYNQLFGTRPLAGILVGLLQHVQRLDVGRFRDGWIETDGEGGHLIRIHTRNGGSNREPQAAAIESMRAHPWYVRDEDLPYDETYADFYFRPVPFGEFDQETYERLCMTAVDHVDLGKVWEETMDGMSKP